MPKVQRKRTAKPRENKATQQPEREVKRPIAKEIWKAGTMLCPVPVVLVSSMTKDGRPNMATVAWTGNVCSEPPMLSISMRKATYTHGLIMASREFVVNVPSARLIRVTDYCGVVSGRDIDKFEETGLTPAPASVVKAPIVAECPINIECAVRQVLELGLHTMFVAEIMAVQVTKRLITPSGRLAIEIAGLAAYAHGDYYALGKKIGYFGYSVRKRGAKK
jgi:flavin reductase (DIM6/NTAB) family NADH-FMN oxidoreductase RutF